MFVSTDFASIRPGDYVWDNGAQKSRCVVSKVKFGPYICLTLTGGVKFEGEPFSIVTVEEQPLY